MQKKCDIATIAYFYKFSYYLSKELSFDWNQMSQQQYSIELFDPSLHYFCNFCRKSLKESVRVIAKLNQECGNFVVNLCPPCLASQRYATKVSQYYVCKKVTRPLDRSSKVTASQALQAIRTIQQEGIEQMFLRGLNPSDKMYNVYKDLNRQIFKSDDLKLKINFDQCKISTGGVPKEKPNPPNRKHLKALGYNWERQEFSFQPEISFGYLMSCLEEQEEQTDEDIQLRNIIYNYYNKQMEVVKQVNDFLVNSPFLLARKAIYELHQVPKEISDLRQIENQIKELVSQISNISIQEETTEKQSQSRQKKGKKEKNKKHLKEDKDQRSRTRQKKIKKKNRKTSQSVEVPESLKKQPQLTSQPLQQTVIKDLDKSSASESGSAAGSTVEVKKKRGRPKGSKSKVKVQRRKRKDRVFQLKMDIGNKIGNKRERIDQKREEKEREEGQLKRKRKMSSNDEEDEHYEESQDDN